MKGCSRREGACGTHALTGWAATCRRDVVAGMSSAPCGVFATARHDVRIPTGWCAELLGRAGQLTTWSGQGAEDDSALRVAMRDHDVQGRHFRTGAELESPGRSCRPCEAAAASDANGPQAPTTASHRVSPQKMISSRVRGLRRGARPRAAARTSRRLPAPR